jgi:hypothetical protein
VTLPFTFNPFDPSLDPLTLNPGARVFSGPSNHVTRGSHFRDVINSLGGFGEGFDALLTSSKISSDSSALEEDSVFKEIPGD